MAYQGKFSQPRNTGAPVQPKTESPKAAPKAAPVRKAPVTPEAVRAEEPVQKPAPKKVAPAQDTPVVREVPKVVESVKKQAPKTEEPAKKQAPKKTSSANSQPAPTKKSGKKKKKANRTVTLVFYTCYFVMVAAILGGLFFVHSWLNNYLTDYEASQPTTRCEEIFQTNFANPDWAKLYTMAGLSDTEYEGKDAFATYMDAKVGSAEITYVETSAGLSGGHKYLLKLGDETIGYFTLVNTAKDGDVADWQLGQISLNYGYGSSVTVQTMEGITVYVNGVALTDDHTVQIGTTKVEEYLPSGVHGPRIYTQYLDGLMAEPEVTATDADGNSVEITYNAESNTYVVLTSENTITTEDYDRVLMTAKTYALRMIEKATKQELSKYFDSRSESYKTIVSIDPWMQEWFFSSYKWGEESITGYYRHSDTLFSVHVDLSMFVTRTDDTVKEYKVNHSFLFEKQNGNWKCINMTNVDFREQSAIVRLTFKLGDSVIYTNLFNEDISTLELPTVTAPEGKVFSGWFRLETAADGSRAYTQVFAPEENGKVNLPAGTRLQPMTLYALFENVSDNGGNN